MNELQAVTTTEMAHRIAEAMRDVAANHHEGAKANALEKSIAEIAAAVASLASALTVRGTCS